MNREKLLSSKMKRLNKKEGSFHIGAGRDSEGRSLKTHGVTYSVDEVKIELIRQYGFKQFVSEKDFINAVVGKKHTEKGETKTITENQARFYRSSHIWSCKKSLLVKKVDASFIPFEMLGGLSSDWLYVLMGVYHACGGYKAENTVATIRFKESDGNGDFLNWVATNANWRIVKDNGYVELQWLKPGKTASEIEERNMSLLTGYFIKYLKSDKTLSQEFFSEMSAYQKQLFLIGVFYGSGSASWSKRTKNSSISERLSTRCVLTATPADWSGKQAAQLKCFIDSALGSSTCVSEKPSWNILIKSKDIKLLSNIAEKLFNRFIVPVPRKIKQLLIINKYSRIDKEINLVNAKMIKKSVRDYSENEIEILSTYLNTHITKTNSDRECIEIQNFAPIDDAVIGKAVIFAEKLKHKEPNQSAMNIAKQVMANNRFKKLSDCNINQVRSRLIGLSPSLSRRHKG